METIKIRSLNFSRTHDHNLVLHALTELERIPALTKDEDKLVADVLQTLSDNSPTRPIMGCAVTLGRLLERGELRTQAQDEPTP